MSDLLSLVLFFGIVFLIMVLFLFRSHFKFLEKFLEDPKQKLRRQYERGEITKEEFEKKLKFLESCG